MPWRFVRFGVAGLANTFIGYGVILLAMSVGAGDYLANAIGYATGVVVSFAINRSFTFQVRRRISQGEVLRYCAAFAAAYACNFAALTIARQELGSGSWVAQLLAVIVYAIAFYLLSARFVFNERRS